MAKATMQKISGGWLVTTPQITIGKITHNSVPMWFKYKKDAATIVAAINTGNYAPMQVFPMPWSVIPK